jgi:nucleotide-binding universal stress UspA family protein
MEGGVEVKAILAAVDTSAAARPVLQIVAALGDPDVALAVLGVGGSPAGRRPAGSTALAVATRAIKPVVVVPEPRDPAPVRRVAHVGRADGP